MNTRTLVLALVALTFGAGTAEAQTIYDGHTYWVSEIRMDWFDAEAWAADFGGYLVSLNTGAEEIFVRSLVSGSVGTDELSDPRYHIGLTDRDEEGVWRWLDGTAPSYTNWRSGEPNNWTSYGSNPEGEDYVQANVVGSYWNDIAGDGGGDTDNIDLYNYAVAEVPTVVPEPATLLLLGTGLVGLAGMAWRRRERDADG